MKYTLMLGSHGRHEKRGGEMVHVVYRKGDAIELSDIEASSSELKYRITPIREALDEMPAVSESKAMGQKR